MSKQKIIAIAGNPNCGKTTLFNSLTGGKIKTGNWPGVTVEKKEGIIKYQDDDLNLVDLPGIYSFSAHSEDEKAARDFILSGEPDLLINIVDATNLERNMYLTTQLIEMKVPIILVVNMMDMAEKKHVKINLDKLGGKLGFPVIGISAVNKEDTEKVKIEIKNAIQNKKLSKTKIEYPNEVEEVIKKWAPKLTNVAKDIGADARWVAIKVIEDETWTKKKVLETNSLSELEINTQNKRIENILDDSTDIILADYRYGFIHGIVKDVVRKLLHKRSATDKADKVILNRFLGIPIFLLIMYVVFWMTITVGGAFIDFFDGFFGTICVDGFGALLWKMGSPEWLVSILAGGIGAGIQTVSTFIPIIFMMFLMLSLLEDSGYMARAAFVMDRFMRFIGLPGKSFVPMLVGFGCTVPGIMATRTLASKKDRFLTIFMAPFMSCGARLPVYALFIAAFFPKSSGIVLFSLYFTGIILAIITGLIMKKTLFKGEPSYFIMELPPYHMPRIKHIMLHTWDRLKIFMLKAGKVIVIAVTIVSFFNSLGTDGSFGNEDSENSVLAKVGISITPIFEPMGIEKENWPATVGIFTGLFAKEAVVGTLNSLYSQIDIASAEESVEEGGFDFWGGIMDSFKSIPEGLSGIFDGLSDPLGLGLVAESDTGALAEEIGAEKRVFVLIKKYFSKGGYQAYAYLLFILLYFPCLAALGVIVREVGLFIGIINVIYLTLLGWIIATLFYQFTIGHQFIWIIAPLILMGLIVLAFNILGKTKRFKFEV